MKVQPIKIIYWWTFNDLGSNKRKINRVVCRKSVYQKLKVSPIFDTFTKLGYTLARWQVRDEQSKTVPRLHILHGVKIWLEDETHLPSC